MWQDMPKDPDHASGSFGLMAVRSSPAVGAARTAAARPDLFTDGVAATGLPASTARLSQISSGSTIIQRPEQTTGSQEVRHGTGPRTP